MIQQYYFELYRKHMRCYIFKEGHNKVNFHEDCIFYLFDVISWDDIKKRVVELDTLEDIENSENNLRNSALEILSREDRMPFSAEEMRRVLNIISSYGALSLDTLAESISLDLRPKIKNLPSGQSLFFDFLFPSAEVPCQYIVRQGMLTLARESMKYGFSKRIAAEYAEGIGYIEREGLDECKFEDISYLEKWVNSYFASGKNVEDVDEEIRDFFLRKVFLRAAQQTSSGILFKHFRKTKEYSTMNSLRFISLGINYNERYRKIRTLFFRNLERWLKLNNLDSTTFEFYLDD